MPNGHRSQRSSSAAPTVAASSARGKTGSGVVVRRGHTASVIDAPPPSRRHRGCPGRRSTTPSASDYLRSITTILWATRGRSHVATGEPPPRGMPTSLERPQPPQEPPMTMSRRTAGRERQHGPFRVGPRRDRARRHPSDCPRDVVRGQAVRRSSRHERGPATGLRTSPCRQYTVPRGQALTMSRLWTPVTPGEDQAACSACRRSAHDDTLPVNSTS